MASSKSSLAIVHKDPDKFLELSEGPQLSAYEMTILRLKTALGILRRTHEMVLAMRIGRQRRRFCNWSSVVVTCGWGIKRYIIKS